MWEKPPSLHFVRHSSLCETCISYRDSSIITSNGTSVKGKEGEIPFDLRHARCAALEKTACEQRRTDHGRQHELGRGRTDQSEATHPRGNLRGGQAPAARGTDALGGRGGRCRLCLASHGLPLLPYPGVPALGGGTGERQDRHQSPAREVCTLR